jgi:hypothetical protein
MMFREFPCWHVDPALDLCWSEGLCMGSERCLPVCQGASCSSTLHLPAVLLHMRGPYLQLPVNHVTKPGSNQGLW